MTLKEYYAGHHPLQYMFDVRIRTLGLYQPFASLMHHGKIETRWVMKGKKPPFPLGLYLIYSTQKRYELGKIMEISGRKCFDWMEQVLSNHGRGRDETVEKCGYALSIGYLYQVDRMTTDMELECFVEYKESETHDLYALRFKNVLQLEPYQWKHGKQGIGFVPVEEYDSIILKTLPGK